MCCPRLCSHGGWLLLKCSAIGIGFNEAETNCGIARILGILLINSWDTLVYFLATTCTIICSLSTLNLRKKPCLLVYSWCCLSLFGRFSAFSSSFSSVIVLSAMTRIVASLCRINNLRAITKTNASVRNANLLYSK